MSEWLLNVNSNFLSCGKLRIIFSLCHMSTLIRGVCVGMVIWGGVARADGKNEANN